MHQVLDLCADHGGGEPGELADASAVIEQMGHIAGLLHQGMGAKVEKPAIGPGVVDQGARENPGEAFLQPAGHTLPVRHHPFHRAPISRAQGVQFVDGDDDLAGGHLAADLGSLHLEADPAR